MREPSTVPWDIQVREMTKEEVRLFAHHLDEMAERYWAMHLDADRQGTRPAEGFKLEAKTYEDAHRALLWVIAGLDPKTGARRG